MKKIFTAALLAAAVSAGAQSTNPAPYCTGAFTTTQDFITSVSVDQFFNSTAGNVSPTGYDYYNNIAGPTLAAGGTYTATIDFANFPTVHYVGVFIDFNGNTDFNDPGELVLNQFITNQQGQPTSPAVQSFTVPATATPGTVRMRVILLEDDDYTFGTQIQPPGPYSCVPTSSPNNFQMGQTQDYDVVITGGTGQQAPSATTQAASNITSVSGTLNAIVTANGAPTTIAFEYGTTPAYGQTANANPATMAANVSGTANAVLNGLTPNTTYHYRVQATNAAGTSNGADMTFTTAAPAAPLPTVTTGAVANVTATSARLSGTVNANGTATAVRFEYGTTPALTRSAIASPATVSGNTTTSVSATPTGLLPYTTYYYRIRATNAGGTDTGAVRTFQTGTAAPTATATAATRITSSTATMNGKVSANGAPTTVIFEYGLTTAYGLTAAATPATVSGTANVSKALTGLMPGTTYHYRIRATSSLGTTVSSDRTFQTNGPEPVITINNATHVIDSGAEVSGTVNANGLATTVVFEYGTTTAFGQTLAATPATVSGNATVAVHATLTGLQPSTTYYYRIAATKNGVTQTSARKSFRTNAAQPTPVVTTTNATQVSGNNATLNGTVIANGGATTAIFEYGLTTAYGQTAVATPDTINGVAPTSVSAAISGLLPNKTYHFRLRATNRGGSSSGSNRTFKTSAMGVVDWEAEKTFVIAPNPSGGVMRLLQNGALPQKPLKAVFFNLAGQCALQTIPDADGTIHAEALPAGLYQLHLSDSEGRLEVHSVAIQK